MNSTNSWRWRLSVVALVLGVVTIYTGFEVWQRRDRRAARSAADASAAGRPMLPEEDAAKIRGFVSNMMNSGMKPSDTDRAVCEEAVAGLREYLDGLARDKSPNAAPAMCLTAEAIAAKFPGFDFSVRQQALGLLSDILGWFGEHESSCWAAVLRPAKSILTAAFADGWTDLTVAALKIASSCWEWAPPEVTDSGQRKSLGMWKAELHDECVALLTSDNGKVRIEAVTAVASVPIDNAAAKALVLLNDPIALIRRTVLLTLSSRTEVLVSEDVIPFLSDPDGRVRAAAELVLTTRGLSREQVSLAKRAADPSPLVRSQLPRYVLESSVVDRAVWLKHLSRDEDASVRTEAVQAMAQLHDEDCDARLAEMAASDPDLDVRQLAREVASSASAAARSRDRIRANLGSPMPSAGKNRTAN